jgi:gliding motility-associated-like protein
VEVSSARRFSTLSATICEGQSYSGHTASGTYVDTFTLPNGCDSMRTLQLTVKPKIVAAHAVAICPDQSYTLPWGPVVSTSGIYRDTIRYISGCDSLIREVNLKIIILDHDKIDAAICANQWYTLPWGIKVNQAGLYRDTLRSNAGCDSLIRSVNLVVKPIPVTSVSSSNDIDCMLGTTKLLATGGVNYKWSPAASLSNASINQPIASPESSTTYHVNVTAANGCSAEDSILVSVAFNNTEKGFLVPSAFTPGNDGKNDCFGVRFWGATHNFSMSIFNRWGERVFYSTDNHQCWNGKVNEKEAPAGVYIYFITAKTICGAVTKKGTFILLR